jgi:hypothetical protein
LTWLILWILTRWLLGRMHFQPFQVHEMEVNWKVGQKVEGWNAIFTNWRGFGFTNSIKNNIALIIFQCCPITTYYNAITCAITPHMAIMKTRANNILCLRSSIMCKKNKKKFKKNKIHERKEEERKDLILLLSYVNHTFSILVPRIGPQAFRHTHCTL